MLDCILIRLGDVIRLHSNFLGLSQIHQANALSAGESVLAVGLPGEPRANEHVPVLFCLSKCFIPAYFFV